MGYSLKDFTESISQAGEDIAREAGAAGDYVFGGQLAEDVGNVFSPGTWSFFDFDIDIPETDLAKGTLLNKQGNVHHLPVIYGERRVGGIRVFVGVSGSENEYLHIVLALCEGEIDALKLIEEGIPSISSTGGASTFKEEWVEQLKNKGETSWVYCPDIADCRYEKK